MSRERETSKGDEHIQLVGKKIATCKYGENAYQTPAYLFSSETDDPLGLDKFVVIEGSAPSFNNWVDLDRLLQTMTHIMAAYATNAHVESLNIAIGGKHGNTCGAAIDVNALRLMMAGDPLAIFGGLVMTNFQIGDSAVEHLSGKMLDGIIAPDFTAGAIEKLKRKGNKCRFIKNPALQNLDLNSLDTKNRFRYVRGGFLQQPNYTFVPNFTKKESFQQYGTISIDKMDDLLLAWAIGSTSNSNTITLVKNGHLIGNGVGQQDRVGAAKLAIERARRSGHALTGAVAYSDSFFPFPDGPQVLLDAGVTAILTSSGSVNDQKTIDLCQERDACLIMIPDAVGRGFFGH